jgi:hypothetical protein
MIIKNKNTISGKSYNYSTGSGLNILEWFCITVLPLIQGVSIYFIISSITDFVWWVNLIITFSIWSVLLVLIYLLSWWMTENDILK